MRKLWWMKNLNNFGDVLSPIIFNHFKIPYREVDEENFDTLCVGSIASLARAGTMVLGSGTSRWKTPLDPRADYRFVRGPLTRKKILESDGRCPDVYGDPAMLLPLICEESDKEHKLGLVPHYVDYRSVKRDYPHHPVVDLLNEDPLQVCREITKCEKIISSSLHGLICAHAYGIPAAWVRFGGKIKGDGTKFKDHYLAGGKEAVLSTVRNPVFQDVNFDTKQIANIFKTI